MRKLLLAVTVFLLTAGLWAQTAQTASDDAAQLRQEINQLKTTINSLEKRLDAQESATKSAAARPAAPNEVVSDLQASVRDLNERTNQAERKSFAIAWSGVATIDTKCIPFGATFPLTTTGCECKT